MKVTTRDQLIKLLMEHEHEYISGQALSERLHISRTAIWKHMKELEKDGYHIEAYPKKGYRIASPNHRFNASTIKWGLQTKWLGQTVVFEEVVDSTQDVAHKTAQKGAEHGTIVVTDKQLKGRGRRNRIWASDHAEGLWLSMILRPELSPFEASQFTLFTAVSLVETLQKLTGLTIHIKWPNDLYIRNRKVCGILTEMQAELESVNYIIIGFGLNVNQTEDHFTDAIRERSTSLSLESNRTWDRIQLLQAILEDFETNYYKYQQEGFSYIRKKWLHYAYKLGEEVKIITPHRSFFGIIDGISADGALIVLNENGEKEVIYSAEIHW
ncbi:biotin [acetyl-CoA carboxylase] ligase [Gracilibacillus halophilus YIM-C55.5]|uniref:Bifunctional ligase/repressor BirA n=1 Tax=Gracilibacillus halophilus YIM-C55.5 TaxID=1308866 RepID=N4WSE4_9BACI|nr:biotin--[acetyl-CoA-carboxylase] ligase [Gracilibacillus halophilus]ENH97320.1 biotin [acetyl-CoA carboxylase] ligase [Gracilibacillus halophilus YIM-C55.5]